MSIPGSTSPLLLAKAGYQIERSLRFNSSDSAYLSRTPASAGNRKTWTLVLWHKRSSLSGYTFFAAGDGTAGNRVAVDFDSDQLRLIMGDGTNLVSSTQVFRDPSAWYHFVIAVDTTQGTAANRVKLYINGSEITALSSTSYPSQNYDTFVNAANLHVIGARYRTSVDGYSNGYLADIHLIDGQALDPSSFGFFDTNNVWQPKAYLGSYGTNGFQLNFADNSNNTAATLGKDTSGNGNNWTPTNLSVTAGSGNDSLVDTPTNYNSGIGLGGVVRGNYATLNPLLDTTGTYSNGNLQKTSTDLFGGLATICPSSGKYYIEFKWTAKNASTTCFVLVTNVIARSSTTTLLNANTASWASNGLANAFGDEFAGGTWPFGVNDIVRISLDADTGTVSFSINSQWVGSVNSVLWLGMPLAVGFGYEGTAGTNTVEVNFGQRPYEYSPPAGYLPLCSANLATPIAKPDEVMDVVTRTFTGAFEYYSGLKFTPDFLWFKRRDAVGIHSLFNSIRGADKRLPSNLAQAETTLTDALLTFAPNGFTVGVDAGSNSVNGPVNGTGVVWCWDAGSSTVTNNNGTISSQVRANAAAGFSIVTYTGNSTSGATFGHGLGVAPQFVMVKSTSALGWAVYHASRGNTKYLSLELPNAEVTSSTAWNNTSPSSSVVTLGNGSLVNSDTLTYVAYCFAPVQGYSSFGSYVGNGNSNGTFVYTGHRSAFVLIKNTTGTSGQWMIYDAKRGLFNLNGKKLAASINDAENNATSMGADTVGIDFLSNGFKIRNTDANHNTNGVSYIYASFAEAPFSLARAR